MFEPPTNQNPNSNGGIINHRNRSVRSDNGAQDESPPFLSASLGDGSRRLIPVLPPLRLSSINPPIPQIFFSYIQPIDFINPAPVQSVRGFVIIPEDSQLGLSK